MNLVPRPKGPVAVVTGATSGLGREIAAQLARRGATVVVVGRGAERAEAVARAISSAEGCPPAEAIGVRDLALREDQRKLGQELLRRYPRIDVLVNNAGGIFLRREVTPDGLERTFALNVLAPYALTADLWDRMSETPGARVVNVASAAHRGQRVDLADLQGEGGYRGWRAYGRSKLALILLTREFSRRAAGPGPRVNAVHPGFVRTGFAQNNGGWTAAGVRFAAWVGGRSVSRGAETPVSVATDPQFASVTGEYVADRRIRAGSAASRDPTTAARLFQECERLTRGGGAVPTERSPSAG